MVLDQPLVVYPKDKDASVSHTKKEADEIYDKWIENKRNRGGYLKGETISLNEYLRTKIDN